METRLDTILNDKGHQLHVVEPEATVIEAVEVMNRERIGAVLVVAGEARLVGIFTERDILSRVIEQARDASETAVKEVMTRRVVTVLPSLTAEEAMAVMTQKRCRHLPVIDDGELLGLVSIGDLSCWMVHDKNYLIDQLFNYVTDQYPA